MSKPKEDKEKDAWAEYKKASETAYAEYMEVLWPSWSEYEKVRAPAYVKYIKRMKEIWDES
jgi:hypothetical protein